MAVDKDGVQIPDTVDAGNFVPVVDYGTTYRPTIAGVTAHLGGDQDLPEDDGKTFKQQGYIPPANRDGQLGEDKPLVAKKIDAELAVINGINTQPQLVQPVTQIAKDSDLSTDSTDPVENVTDQVSPGAVTPAATDSFPTTVGEDNGTVTESSPDSVDSETHAL